MAIFETSNKRKNYKLVGVHLPPQEHNYLSLYAMVKKTTKSKLFLSLIRKWIEKETITNKNSDLVNELTQQINQHWQCSPKKSFSQFQKEVRNELRKKGIAPSTISLILLKMEE